jgi:hypothetical protein
MSNLAHSFLGCKKLNAYNECAPKRICVNSNGESRTKNKSSSVAAALSGACPMSLVRLGLERQTIAILQSLHGYVRL